MHDPKEILEICSRATEGPWVRLDTPDYSEIYASPVISASSPLALVAGEVNADFIAFARVALPEFAQRVIELEKENANLRAVAEVAKHFYGICFDMPIDFPSAGPFVWGMGDLKDALAAAGYGGDE